MGKRKSDRLLAVLWKGLTVFDLIAATILAASFAIPTPLGESAQAHVMPVLLVAVVVTGLVGATLTQRGADPHSQFERTVRAVSSPAVLFVMALLTVTNVLGLASTIRIQNGALAAISQSQDTMLSLFQPPLLDAPHLWQGRVFPATAGCSGLAVAPPWPWSVQPR
jgi:hypothetical protein